MSLQTLRILALTRGSTAGLSTLIDGLTTRLVRLACRQTAPDLCERLEEEWLAHLSDRRGRTARLSFALGCCWAAAMISLECPVRVPVAATPTAVRTLRMGTPGGSSSFPMRAAPAAGASICDINTTPLIDVMLVLLVTLIITLPMVTHAVKLDLSHPLSAQQEPPPEVISLDIDADGTIVWNGTAVASPEQLASYFHNEAQRSPQPEIHLRPDRRARYDVVAKVLASAQHNRMSRIGFVNTAQFGD